MTTGERAGQQGPIDTLAMKLADLKGELRTTIGQVDDVQAKAMLETGAEVLGGLRKAFVDYQAGTEKAWRH